MPALLAAEVIGPAQWLVCAPPRGFSKRKIGIEITKYAIRRVRNGVYLAGAYSSILQLAAVVQQFAMSSPWALARLWANVLDFYKELNPATLTGAVDVIVVEQPNGDLRCSPFHVRFGKMGVLRSKEKIVEVAVNDVTVPIQMILSDGGEAFFVESVERVEEMACRSPKVTVSQRHVEVPVHFNNVSEDAEAMPSEPKQNESSEPVEPPSMPCKEILEGVAFSLCGGLETEGGSVPEEQFDAHQVTYEQFNSDTDLLSNPDLVIRISGKCYSWRVAGPILVSIIVFDQPLSDSAIDKLIRIEQPKMHDARDVTRKSDITGAASVSSYFWWRRATSADPPAKSQEPGMAIPADQQATEEPPESPPPSDIPFPPGTAKSDSQLEENEDRFGFDDRGALSDSELEETRKSEIRARYKTTLYLTSDQLKSLNLQRGVPNKACFSVTTKYQGTCICECEIWLWQYDDKVIVSDIDGTITKSDVLGHIIPRVGVGHWAHIGVAELFDRISSNDYKILYLTARAIGLASQTKEYLKSVQQDKYALPGGPLLLAPTSVFNALHREIIEKKPEIFKTSCLREVASLFPSAINAFFGGFGNRPNDVVAYEAAGIPSNKIYIIDPTGRVEFLDKRLEFSYQRIADLVDHLFPPLHRARVEKDTGPAAPMEYNSSQYWRAQVLDIDIDLAKFPKPNTPKGRSNTRSSSTSSSLGWSKKK